MRSRGSAGVSPTAHYTGAVWSRHGLSHPALATLEGRLLHGAIAPAMLAARLAGGPTLEGFLLARHRVIDHLLAEAVEGGRIGQIVELAAGLSPRGWRFTERYGDAVSYVEADLPGMAQRKRRALARLGARPRVVELDVLAPGGLDVIATTLDPARGVAVITEGLLNYLDRRSVEGLWARVSRALERFPHGLYLSDLHLRDETEAAGLPARAFTELLSAFVRGRVHLHFADAEEAAAALRLAGFPSVEVHRPESFAAVAPEAPGAHLVRVVEARTR